MATLARLLRPSRSLFCTDSAPAEICTLSLHDALPICVHVTGPASDWMLSHGYEWQLNDRISSEMLRLPLDWRSEEHTSELQSRRDLVCRLLLEKKKSDTQSLRLWAIPAPTPQRSRPIT